MQRRIWLSQLVVLSLLIVALPLAGQEKSAPSDIAAVRAAIERANAEWASASLRHDAAAIAAQYTEDAVIMGPGAPAAAGRGVIETGVAQMPRILEPRMSILELDVLGATAIERGTFHMTLAAPGGRPVTDDGKYLTVWKRGSDGVWRRHRECFNSDLPEPSPPVRAAAGDTVFVVLNHVKPEMRAEFERQANEVWLGAWRKLAETEAVYRSAVPAVRFLAPLGPEGDGSYTYVTLIDPLQPGADFTARGTLGRLYAPGEVEEIVRTWMANMARPQEGYRLVQQK